MRYGQDINGYRVVTQPSNQNAGKCVWAFAERDGKEFFIKEFLDPKIPRTDGMGSVEDKQRRFAECARFEAWHHNLRTLLRPDDERAGNLVLAVDFFPKDSRFYKVTRRIHGAEVIPHRLTPDQQRVLLCTLADSLQLLHDKGFVHGDLKPENVLPHRPEHSDFYTAKLIDFDDAYLAGQPPPREEIGGDPRYGAPEWLRYLQGDETVEAAGLTQAADVFAFALLIHTYLFGALPSHDTAHDSPAAAVAAGAPLVWDSRAGAGLVTLLDALTQPDPAARPSMASAAEVLASPALFATAAPSRVRINLNGRRPTDGRTDSDT